MALRKDDIHKLVDQLSENDQKTAYDFLQYLIERSEKKHASWDEINKLEPDHEPLSEEETRQLKSNSGYISGEEAKREFGLQVDLP